MSQQLLDVPSPERPGAILTSHVMAVTYTGGIIGIFSDKKRRLQDTIQNENNRGFRLRHVLPSRPTAFSALVQFVCLCLTLMFWCQEPGETLIFERTGA